MTKTPATRHTEDDKNGPAERSRDKKTSGERRRMTNMDTPRDEGMIARPARDGGMTKTDPPRDGGMTTRPARDAG